MASSEQYTLEQAEEDIATLRGQVDLLTEYIATATLVATDVQSVTAEISGAITATGGTAAAPTLITTDSWNSLGTLTGYTVGTARYRLTTDGEVEIDVSVTSGGSNSGTTTFSTDLPTGYIPTTSHTFPMSSTRAVTAADVWPRLFVTASTGAVQVVTTANVANGVRLDCTVRCPLN